MQIEDFVDGRQRENITNNSNSMYIAEDEKNTTQISHASLYNRGKRFRDRSEGQPTQIKHTSRTRQRPAEWYTNDAGAETRVEISRQEFQRNNYHGVIRTGQ